MFSTTALLTLRVSESLEGCSLGGAGFAARVVFLVRLFEEVLVLFLDVRDFLPDDFLLEEAEDFFLFLLLVLFLLDFFFAEAEAEAIAEEFAAEASKSGEI